jgi:uncharacterized protein YwgA
MNIKDFLSILIREGLLKVNGKEDIDSNTDNAFENRIKIQKFVYLAESFGIELGYSNTYSMYVYGPYSPALANEYYKLAREGFFDTTPSIKEDVKRDIKEEKVKRFIEFIKSSNSKRNNIDWLEVATTAIDLAKDYDSRERDSKERLVDHIAWIKPRFDRAFIMNVINELEENSLIYYQ